MFIKQFQNNYQPNVFSDHGHQQRIQTRRCGKNNTLEMTLFYTTFVFHHKILTYYF